MTTGIEESEPLLIKNQGKLIFDATCTPADIAYPTDINLLNQAREQTEKILDRLYEQVREQFSRKPQTYRQKARKDYLAITKQRRPSQKKRGIRISAPPLGRPALNQDPAIIQQQLQDERFRNAIEGKFGQAKRRFSLGRIMAKLSLTAESSIAITLLVMNLELLLKQFLIFFFARFRYFVDFSKFFFYDLGIEKDFSLLCLIQFYHQTFSVSPN